MRQWAAVFHPRGARDSSGEADLVLALNKQAYKLPGLIYIRHA